MAYWLARPIICQMAARAWQSRRWSSSWVCHQLLRPDRLPCFPEIYQSIGGIELDIKEKITVDPIGEGNTVVLKPGKQTLKGALPWPTPAPATPKVVISTAPTAARSDDGHPRPRHRTGRFPELLTKSPILYDQLSKASIPI